VSDPTLFSPAILARFMSKVNKTSDCWLWTAYCNPAGYGKFAIGRLPQWYAHRWSYTQFVGPIPDGLQIDHLCRVKACVNPDHLEAVTGAVNTRRAADVVTHCPKGHEYTPENTYVNNTKRGPMRDCRECHRLESHAYYHEKVRPRRAARREQ
jgi:hypothetical protein